MAHDPRDSREIPGLPFQGDHAFMLPPIRRARVPEREKRTYRACLHCRQRKSRCDLYGSGEPGKPPCERCIRENHECVLGPSHRGGRRIKRNTTGSEQPENEASHNASSSEDTGQSSVPPVQQDSTREERDDGYHRRLPSWPQYTPGSRSTPASAAEPPTSHPSTKMTVDESIVSTNLQNPSDALEFLANVAGRNEGVAQTPSTHGSIYARSPHQSGADQHVQDATPSSNHPSPAAMQIQFPPYQKGHVSLGMMHALIERYKMKYHHFYSVVPPFMLEAENLAANSVHEPYLLAAVCTIASKDEPSWWDTHEACSTHMQQLIAELMYGGIATLGAVEALLVLAEWVPRPPQSMTAVGRGEEEQTAWMLSGMAIRMGYLLGIDRTGFVNESDPSAPDYIRKRLAWVGCYMSDRHISVRVGKAFWSRGPAMIKFSSRDFQDIKYPGNPMDNFAALCEAHLELTQLFSNAHDVLYSSKNRSAQLNFGGEYVKYIDDFREAMSAWYDRWGKLPCTSVIKAALIISFEYLRLYVNAFAYQATLTRMAQDYSDQQNSHGPQRPNGQATFTDFIAATPDARFIYDSIDSAKKLLTISNTLLDPATEFRYMPLRYYLYVIYSAVFLYKARSTGVLGGDGGNVKRTVGEAVDRLQKASSCQNDVGDRYSRMLRLLWRKPPPQAPATHMNGNEQPYQATAQNAQVPAQTEQQNHMNIEQTTQVPYNNAFTFSWLDLHAVGDFATNNNESMMDSYEGLDDVSGEPAYGHFDPNFVQGQQQQIGWNGFSAPGIIF
ncbi:hypothetical protein D6C93_01266 [Aureobasidium pullulans]|nr:hypothetical protein D6C93_01266 [Aureobasidium pullulans]